MLVSENLLKWIVRFYPPLFFQRIWVVKFHNDFLGVKVKIKKSFFNRNYNNSIFGGTIFAAADPFYPILFHQVFTHKGYKILAWSRASEIQYLKPAVTDLIFEINLTGAEIAEAENILNTEGKYVRSHPLEIYDKNGVNVASLMNEVYVRNLNFTNYALNNE
jgi:hypothetical protein